MNFIKAANPASVDNVLIILTCTVKINPHKHFLFQTDPRERLALYLKSIKQWLEKTSLKICVVENSGYTFPELSNYMETHGSRFEIITFDEMTLTGELQHLKHNNSKGASEMYSIIHAYEHTKFKRDINFAIKVTGRYFIPFFCEYLSVIDIKNTSRNLHIGDREQSIVAMRQSSDTRCEVIGINTLFFHFLFYLNLSNDRGEFFPHVETVYSNRLKVFNQSKVKTMPLFPIEPTQMGGNTYACITTDL